jgi:hypothetical protein
MMRVVSPWSTLWFALPVIVAGAVHIAVIRRGLLPGLGQIALDGGLRVRGRRLFGANKTLRGLVVMPIVAGVVAIALALRHPPANASAHGPGWALARAFAWGASLGAGYILGELPNSFLKRQLDIAPGDAATGRLRGAAFWFIDQIDSLVGILLAARLWGPISWVVVAWLLVIMLVLHPLYAWVMVLLGLKQRVG